MNIILGIIHLMCVDDLLKAHDPTFCHRRSTLISSVKGRDVFPSNFLSRNELFIGPRAAQKNQHNGKKLHPHWVLIDCNAVKKGLKRKFSATAMLRDGIKVKERKSFHLYDFYEICETRGEKRDYTIASFISTREKTLIL